MAYHPAIGRFLEPDPIGYDDGMSLYQYAGSNPVGKTDPLGLQGLPNGYNLLQDLFRRRQDAKVWAAAQKVRLGAKLKTLLPAGDIARVDGCRCTAAEAQAQAQEIADAIVDAVYQVNPDWKPRSGGKLGNWLGETQCGDWQVLIGNAARAVTEKHLLAKKACFEVVYVQMFDIPNGQPNTGHEHNWIEIRTGNSSIIVDPWPNGGQGNVDDTSAIGDYPYPSTKGGKNPSKPIATSVTPPPAATRAASQPTLPTTRPVK